jgi:RNA polymerase sigma factor for flagellar operon FliA
MRVGAVAAAVDPAVRDQLVMAHVNLVKAMASRLRRRLPPQVELSELVSVGVLGLIDAAGRYQPSLGVPFDAFARRRIHGAMLDALRGLDAVPRSMRKLQRQAEDATARLRQSLGREPESDEIAAALGMDLNDYCRVLDDLQATEVATVRGRGHSGSHVNLIDLVIDDDGGPHVTFERVELRHRLAEALRRLPIREQQVLSLSYVEEMTLADIGRVFGIGESRVSQIRTQAVLRLRSLLRPVIEPREAR